MFRKINFLAYYAGINPRKCAFSEVNEAATTGATPAEDGSILPVFGADIDLIDAILYACRALARLHLVHNSGKRN